MCWFIYETDSPQTFFCGLFITCCEIGGIYFPFTPPPHLSAAASSSSSARWFTPAASPPQLPAVKPHFLLYFKELTLTILPPPPTHTLTELRCHKPNTSNIHCTLTHRCCGVSQDRLHLTAVSPALVISTADLMCKHERDADIYI